MSKQYFYLTKGKDQIGVKQNFTNDTYIIAINDKRIELDLYNDEDLEFLENISNIIKEDVLRIKKDKTLFNK